MSGAPRSFVRRHLVKLIASALITLGFVYTAHRGGLKFVPEGGDFSEVRWASLALYVPLFAAMTWFRAVRWRYLLRSMTELPRRRILAVSCTGFLAILALPFRLGELARPYMITARPESHSAEPSRLTLTAAMSSIVAERVIDGVFLSLVLAIALLVVPTIVPLPAQVVGLPISVSQIRGAGFAMLGLFSAALVAITVFYFARAWAVRATRVVIGVVSMRLADRLAAMVSKLADGLHVFGRGRDALGFLAESTAYWGLNATGMWVLALGCGLRHVDGSGITFAESCALMGMLGTTILIPGPPGLLGVFQAGLYAGMTMYFPATTVIGPGAAYVFLLYVSQVAATAVFGLWGIWAEGGAQHLRAALEESESVEAT
ncbi:MAG: lysylphosphatidylglycerol synthase transmembrane domain-containing protein [Kofleriaceae bacterium]